MPSPSVKILREYAEGHSFLSAHHQTPSRRRPLVFIHGMTGLAEYFVPMMHYLGEHTKRTGYSVDIMGHGHHAHQDIAKACIDDYVADVAHFLKRVVIQTHGVLPILIGHSMGGLIALALAARGYAERAVLITPAPPRGIKNRFGKIILPTAGDAANYLRMRLTGAPFRPSAQVLEQIFANPDVDRKLIKEICEEFEVRESLTVVNELRNSMFPVDPRAVKVPLVVIGTRKDVIIHPSVFARIARMYAAELKVFPELGHFCPFETGYESVAEYIGNWVTERKRWKRKT